MGKSDKFVKPFYSKNIDVTQPAALLGSTNNDIFDGDLYDLQLDNWNINSDWHLPKRYSTVVCTRCAYFSKDPEKFISRCYDSLVDGGTLYVDWGLGDHWRFPKFRVGWKDSEVHEYAYADDNFLWSALWDKSFLENPSVQKFAEEISKHGYDDIEKAIFDEVPVILSPNKLTGWDWQVSFLAIERPYTQLYMLFRGVKE
jgi:SAM-dependent methyltransferase